MYVTITVIWLNRSPMYPPSISTSCELESILPSNPSSSPSFMSFTYICSQAISQGCSRVHDWLSKTKRSTEEQPAGIYLHLITTIVVVCSGKHKPSTTVGNYKENSTTHTLQDMSKTGECSRGLDSSPH